MADSDISTFRYTAIDPTGGRVTRQMRAADEAAVRSALHAQGYSPLEVRSATSGLNADLGLMLGSRRAPKMNTRQLSGFVRQLHQLLAAGVALPQILEDLASAAEPGAEKQMLAEIAARLQSGARPSEAFAGYPKVFNDVFLANLEAAQEAGTMDITMGELTRILDKRVQLENRVKAALSYPVLMAIVMTLMIIGILLFLVPTFEDLFADFGAELPAPTRMMIAASNHAVKGIAVVAAGTVVGLRWLKHAKADLAFAAALDRARYRTWLFGPLMHAMALYRWAATLAASMDVGVPVSNALALSGRSSGSAWIAQVMGKAQESVQTGKGMTGPMVEETALFPRIGVGQLLALGERSGSMSEMLRHIAAAQAEAVDTILASMEAKLQAIMILAIGGVVGGMIICLYLPIIAISSEGAQGL